jgi:hypothetical protein
VSPTAKRAERLQRKTLRELLNAGAKTVFGRAAGLHPAMTYEVFAEAIPVQQFEAFIPFIDRMKQGEPDVLWPGKVTRWAVSSGTTGKGKHIPLTEARLLSDQRFHRIVLQRILWRMPALAIGGRVLSLPGTVEPAPWDQKQWVGEVSGHLAHSYKSVFSSRFWRRPEDLAVTPWPEKWEDAVSFASKHSVKVIAGAPAWLEKLVHQCALPDVKLVISGGQKIRPFIDTIREKTSASVRFFENYGASEGFFAAGWQEEDHPLELVLDNGVFLEFEQVETGTTIPLWKAEPETRYRLIVTSNSGLWRLRMDDLVTILPDEKRLAITIHGRNSILLNELGESLMQHEAEAALSGLISGVWFLAGADPQRGIRHHRLFTSDARITAHEVDAALRCASRHVDIRRATGVLGLPGIVVVPRDVLQSFANAKLLRAQSKTRKFLQNDEVVHLEKRAL